MKRRTYLFPLMAMTALSLTLGACDDNKDETATADQAAITAPDATADTAPVAEAPVVAPTIAINADGATSYATADGVTTGVVFVKLSNPNAAADTLKGVMTDKAGTAELHQSYVDEADGTMQMRRVDGIEVPAGGEVTLEPAGYHIMLLDLPAPLVEGETFNVTLQFANSGDLVVPVTVTAPGGVSAATTPAGTPDDGTVIAPATTTDVPVTEAPAATDAPVVDEATPAPESITPVTPTTEVPADAPVTDAPAADAHTGH